ncbi:TPA: replication protein [Neisseria gonorrhoeae]|uniref:DNA replication protein gp18 n=16 Tax=Neisseria gonorrhoeae TaxID=485 RepID=A0AB74EHI5_NEIGO|nr:replication protein [Neisseria gonorrhoeae]MCF3038982.1 replication protein [Neisseria gonorrhoeae]MCF3040995.1 replication protein [Neisseria gonorrhoeae]MCF3053051.1 replication protein [Neisseria gonorrhoeae]MCF3058477.1 replication protein [Neisseria gonorrhoeae]MCF3058711.1 replication protein [Neisseria gonorrhoeae]
MKYIPNSFQIANAVVDDFLCRMSGNAWKCYAVIVRKTTGWQKEIDYISVSQFKNLTGIKTDVTVADALKELVELNLIASVKRHGQVTGYRINMPEPSPENGGTPPPENGGTPPPENGGTATPKNWVHPKNGTTPKNWGVLPPENGGTTTPKNWGSTKHTTKPTNTKHSISASAAADAPLSAEPPESGKRAPAAKAKKTGRHETELSLLADYGITGQVAADFLQVRKAKRQPLTETAMRLIAADAEKCGMTALQAAEYAIASGWGSFRADWLQNKTFGRSGNRGGPTHNQTAAVPDAGSYGDMPTTDF